MDLPFVCIAAMRYEGIVRETLLRFKFEDQPGYATELGRILKDAIQSELKGTYDFISWVPVSAERRKQRGYDQAMLLAMSAANQLGEAAVETLLKKVNNTAQSGLDSAAERRQNVIGVYEAADPELIREKRILLIDDIVTTGATLGEARNVLLRAGAREVCAAVLAHPV